MQQTFRHMNIVKNHMHIKIDLNQKSDLNKNNLIFSEIMIFSNPLQEVW